jgi:hypothetical protein
MRVLLICGPWGSGTTAVAGLAVQLGAIAFDPVFHFRTNDPRTPDSFEFMPFRTIILEHADEPTLTRRPSAPGAAQARLRFLQQRIEAQQFGAYDIDRAAWIVFKYPLSALLLQEICEVFETRLVYVMRPPEQIEQTRRRRRWSAPQLGAAGAAVIYRLMADFEQTGAYPTLTIDYAALLASPLEHASRIARFLDLEPAPARLRQAAAFVAPRPP